MPIEILRAGLRVTAASRDVRYWPIADMGKCTAHVRF